jgi:oligopeptide transport system ATP-binding protein
MSLLSVDNLHVHFHTDDGVVRAVNGLTYALDAGETLAIVGESGSGKSVSCLAVMGLLPQSTAKQPQGTILFNDIELGALSEGERRKIRGNRISMIFQDPMTALNPFLRVSRQLTEVLELHKRLSSKEALRQAIAMLERVGIPDAAKRIHSYPHEFSGGMRQRVMIAMSLLCEPDVLIADEPTTALDVTIQAQILELLASLQKELGMAIILITHDLGVVAGLADQVLVMYGGQVMEHSPTAALFSRPRHPYTQGLLKSIPRLDQGTDAPLHTIDGLPPTMTQEIQGCPFAARCPQVEDACTTQPPPQKNADGNHLYYCWADTGGDA